MIITFKKMIFKDLFEKLGRELNSETMDLIGLAYNNSSHKGDLLLIHLNGFFHHDVLRANALHGYDDSPFVIGPGDIGHSESTHFDFIDDYHNKHTYPESYESYLKHLNDISKDQKELDKIIHDEQISVQIEMLIYLKIWESDLFLKSFCQFARLINGDHYDWYFKITESNRSEGKYKRHEVVRRYIKRILKKHFDVYYRFFNESFNSQIRNAIAHSKYAIMQRNIHLHNYIEEVPYAQKRNLPFDEWAMIFHKTLAIYNEYARINHIINEHFQPIALSNNNTLDIRILEEVISTGDDGDPISKIVEKSHFVEYRPEWDDWKYKQ